MDSERNAVINLFKPERQYRVPYYQRPYVWNQDDQWSQLWSDIQEKADNRLLGLPVTPHFMGAVVLDPQGRKKLIGVEQFHIIDEQQRFTTIQFALTALSIMLRACSTRRSSPPSRPACGIRTSGTCARKTLRYCEHTVRMSTYNVADMIDQINRRLNSRSGYLRRTRGLSAR
jgi:hypothetical protein